jgi:hypothetical protein
MIADAKTQRLPIVLVVKRGFLFAWESRSVLALPYLIYTSVALAAEIALLTIAAPADKALTYAVMGAEQVFAMAFAVGLHRYVLRAEAPPGAAFFRWDRNFVHYVLTALLLFIIAAMVVAIAQLVANSPAQVLNLVVLFAVPAVAVSICRLSMLLPAAALGDPVGASVIWRQTHGNGIRLLAANLLGVAPFFLVEGLLFLGDAAPAGATAPETATMLDIAVTAAIGIVSPAQLIVVTIILSLQYDLLIRGGGPGRPH